MPEKQKSAQKSRAHKESNHTHGGGGKVKLTPLQKILLVDGGMAHHLRTGRRTRAEETKQGRRAIARAEEAVKREKERRRQSKAAAAANSEMVSGMTSLQKASRALRSEEE